MIIEEADFLFHPSGSAAACHERKEPTHDLIFSGGSPIAALQLCERQEQCLRLTVKTKLIESHKPSTHYWYSGDMDWWFSAARRVLEDLHLLLTRQSFADSAQLYRVSLCSPWRCGPWKSDVTWLSRFIHHYCDAEGTSLYPLRNKVDKHLKDLPDILRFDVFLLQCWSEMALEPEQQRTFETIYEINDEAPEICMEALRAYMDTMAPDSEHKQPQEPGADAPWISHPAAHIDQWAEMQPQLAREHQAMFMDYARHLTAECELELETSLVCSSGCPPECREAYVVLRLRALTNRLVSYIDYTVILAQRELGMVNGPGLSSGPSSTASLLSPATPPDW